ncbi:MAG TPA: DUF488 domain-containing protein [Beijerinckia sp.]|jgi:uncharacterized protein (DUF488 family)|nr:DUF488 domain-containing protein [Beijerinckia sp.]
MPTTPLYTIGYEGSSIGDFLATLEAVGIDLLIDVREIPISRKPGFSKAALAAWLAKSDIEYMHLKGLGDPKAGRNAAREGRYDDFRRIFADHLLSDIAKAHLRRGIEAASNRTACLLCFERDHRLCHRQLVAEEMAHGSVGLRLVHLGVQPEAARKKGRGPQQVHDRLPPFLL